MAYAWMIEELNRGRGERFVMKDGDDEKMYIGRIIGDYTGFEPLDDFGMPNAGASSIWYGGKPL